MSRRLIFSNLNLNFVVEGGESAPTPAPMDPGLPGEGVSTVTSIELGDITYNFASPVPAGQFVMGDWWVNHSSDVGLSSIEPPSVREARLMLSGDNSTLAWFDGAMRAPSSPDKVATAMAGTSGGSRQGFMEYSYGHSYQPAYRDDWNIDPGRTGAPIKGTGPIVKMIQPPVLDDTGNSTNKGRGCQQQYECVWLLNGNPPSIAEGDVYFRPPPQHVTPWVWIKARSGGVTTLNMSLLPNLEMPTNRRPSYDETLGRLSHMHIHWWWDQGVSRNMASRNHQYFYGRDYARLTSNALLLLCSNHITIEQKVRLAEAMVQHGIDLAGMVAVGGAPNAQGWGNTSTGRRVCLVLAALLTDNAQLKAALVTAAADPIYFAEDVQIQIINQDDVDHRGYPAALLGRGEWCISWRNAHPNPAWITAEASAVRYRHNWTANLFGTWLGSRLIPGMKSLWGNPAFDDYFTRYIEREEARGWVGENSTDSLNVGNRFALDTYLAYRAAVDAA